MAYKRNNYAYNKSGLRRPGINCDMVNVVERQDPAKIDRENRKEAANRITALVEKGMSLEEAICVVAEQKDIQEKFAYLIKNNIDIKPMLKGAYSAAHSSKKPYYPHIDER